jgi:hypothetical protein
VVSAMLQNVGYAQRLENGLTSRGTPSGSELIFIV